MPKLPLKTELHIAFFHILSSFHPKESHGNLAFPSKLRPVESASKRFRLNVLHQSELCPTRDTLSKHSNKTPVDSTE